MTSITNLPNTPIQGSLFPRIEESNFSNTILFGLEVFRLKPQLRQLIEADQDAHGIEKKRLREADAKWEAEQRRSGQESLFTPQEEVSKEDANAEILSKTKPRLDAELVFTFFLVRAYLGGIKSERQRTFLKDSKFLESHLLQYGLLKTPGPSTILDNLNLLSEKTTEELYKATVDFASAEVQIKRVYVDSTRVSADSAWPTDSRTIFDLLKRVHSGFQILRGQDIKVNLPSDDSELLTLIQSAAKSIALCGGKKGANKERKKQYKLIFKFAKKLIAYFSQACDRIASKISALKPSSKEWAESVTELIRVDLHNVELCIANAENRILKGEKVPAESKVLGISDPDAEMIAKGQKPLVFGYKPQVARSEQGLIVGLIVPQGAATDQSMAVPITTQACENIGYLPTAASFDDGYTDENVREQLQKLGIETVSFSGGKGKALLSDEEYESQLFQSLRNERSWVESTMSTLKVFFDLDRFHRRGLTAVTQELQAVASYHNLSLLAKRRKKAQKQAAA